MCTFNNSSPDLRSTTQLFGIETNYLRIGHQGLPVPHLPRLPEDPVLVAVVLLHPHVSRHILPRQIVLFANTHAAPRVLTTSASGSTSRPRSFPRPTSSSSARTLPRVACSTASAVVVAVVVPVATVTPTAAVTLVRRRAAPPASSSPSSVVASAVAVPPLLATLPSKCSAVPVPAPTTLFRRQRARRSARRLMNGRRAFSPCVRPGRKRGPLSVGVSG